MRIIILITILMLLTGCGQAEQKTKTDACNLIMPQSFDNPMEFDTFGYCYHGVYQLYGKYLYMPSILKFALGVTW